MVVSAWWLLLGYAAVPGLVLLAVLLELPSDPVGWGAALLLLFTIVAHVHRREETKHDWDRALARLLEEESRQRLP